MSKPQVSFRQFIFRLILGFILLLLIVRGFQYISNKDYKDFNRAIIDVIEVLEIKDEISNQQWVSQEVNSDAINRYFFVRIEDSLKNSIVSTDFWRNETITNSVDKISLNDLKLLGDSRFISGTESRFKISPNNLKSLKTGVYELLFHNYKDSLYNHELKELKGDYEFEDKIKLDWNNFEGRWNGPWGQHLIYNNTNKSLRLETVVYGDSQMSKNMIEMNPTITINPGEIINTPKPEFFFKNSPDSKVVTYTNSSWDIRYWLRF